MILKVQLLQKLEQTSRHEAGILCIIIDVYKRFDRICRHRNYWMFSLKTLIILSVLNYIPFVNILLHKEEQIRLNYAS